ncbi:prepilin-type N-terminal cleavage/methylation domain-containing protein [Gracilibacillus marinus]|jgi:prepilin-type N-terminal cleavage/methylation domain-containing protein|uniref:Prepilin-type N-terminal cleavage/methylation domain-containing protein n=1 Tax=Gracilibacillus marinus TaxID=630535 RepID=A0ABV8VPC5_9BACI
MKIKSHKSKIFLLFSNQKGLTLVELLASIVILSIIIVTFTTFFIQSAKTTSMSSDITDATYVAQTEMEEIYHLSTTTTYDDTIQQLNQKYEQCANDVTNLCTTIDGYHVQVTFYDSADVIDTATTLLKNVLIQVHNSSNKLEAQMETKLLWDK